MNFFFFSIFLLISSLANSMNLFDQDIKNSSVFFQKWEYISDKVMGGISDGKAEIINGEDLFLRLSGNVSTKNNGGFIQVRSSKETLSNNFSGIKLKVRGNPSSYYVHVRTNSLLFPWQYYSGEFSVDNNWSYVEIYFKDFKKSNFYQPSSFSSSEIKSIGFVAFGKDFEAKLDIVEAELF